MPRLLPTAPAAVTGTGPGGLRRKPSRARDGYRGREELAPVWDGKHPSRTGRPRVGRERQPARRCGPVRSARCKARLLRAGPAGGSAQNNRTGNTPAATAGACRAGSAAHAKSRAGRTPDVKNAVAALFAQLFPPNMYVP